ncbi:MAG: ATP-binding cassette domain-containing protein, partial [Brevefilum sp.]
QDLEGKQRLSNIHLEVRESEIVGVAGVEGNGQLALVNTIMGRMKAQSGEITCDGEPIQDATILERRKKLAFVSQDRSRLSASLNASIMDNAIMSHHRLNPSLTECDGRLLNPQSVRLFTQKIEKSFSVDMGGPEDLFLSLSGGNQQKLILGRELTLDTPFLLLDQPTRGLDVGSIEYVHRQILAMRDEGHGILLLSSNLDELFRLSDRILVLHRGMIVGQRRVEETTIEEIGLLMLKGEANHEGQ